MIKIVKELQTKLDFTSLDSLSESDFLDSPFEADDEQIQQIIQSLIENASKRSDTDLMASKEIYNWLNAYIKGIEAVIYK